MTSLKTQIKTNVEYLQRIGFISLKKVNKDELSTLLYSILSVFRENLQNKTLKISDNNGNHCYHLNKMVIEQEYRKGLIPYLVIKDNNGNPNIGNSIIISAIFSCILELNLEDIIALDLDKIKKNKTYKCAKIFSNTISILTNDIVIKQEGKIYELSKVCDKTRF
jgi:hypothetical protein